MANTYESKFKGVEVDKGVNIALNLTGAGGIEVKTAGTGIDTIKTIDITSGATLTVNSLNTQFLDVTGAVYARDEIWAGGKITSDTQIAATGVVSSNTALAAPKITGGQLDISGNASAGNVLVQNQISATGSITSLTSLDAPVVNTQKVAYKGTGNSAITLLPDAITITAPSGVTFSNSITVNSGIYGNSGMTLQNGKGITFQSGATKTMGTIMPNTGASGNPTFTLPTKGGTFALTSDIPTGGGGTTITADGVVKTAMNASSTGGTGVLLMTDKYGETHCSTIYADVSGANISVTSTDDKTHSVELFPDKIRFGYDSAGYPIEDGNAVYLKGPSGATWPLLSTIYLPAKSGTIALLSDITGGGSAGVSSIGGKTGAITLGDGLTMSGQQLTPKVKNIYKDSSNYLCIDTN